MTASATDSSNGLFYRIRRWTGLHPHWALTLITVAALLPFLAKPFNFDDPLFIWTAQHIQAHPADPYGFDVNWYGTAQPIWSVTENPPLASYYMALAATIFGWSELGLHTAFLLPALAVILGTFRLARHFCNRPLLAALVTLFTPVFLVSSTTVMCDVLMLAFWVWAVVLWIEGMEQDHFGRLFCAALLITLAALTKYFGACLIPLLAAYSLMGRRQSGRWAVCLLVPISALLLYQRTTSVLYGHGLLFDAGNYTTAFKNTHESSFLTTIFIALGFTGGCLAGAAFFAPLLWRAKTLAIFAGVMAALAFAFFAGGTFFEKHPQIQASKTGIEVQIVFWSIGGVSVLALAVAEMARRRDARTGLLAMWLLGTFLFAAFFNWNVNGRSILPMAPVVGILLVWRLDQNILTGAKAGACGISICLATGVVLALLVTGSDCLLANAVRQSARQIVARHGHGPEALWFQGHWGFQYYMEQMGASPLDLSHSALKRGDKLVLPVNNTNLLRPKREMADVLENISVPGPRLLTTMNEAAGAGFYASLWGPLPFAFGRAPPEESRVYVFTVEPPPASN